MKRPHSFAIEVMEAFIGTTTYSLAHGILRRDSPKYSVLKKTLKLLDWEEFWRFCDYLKLWSWKSEYSPMEIDLVVRDGTFWSLDIAFDKSKRIRTSGNNVYPSFQNEKVPAVSMDRFGLLIDFVDGMLQDNDDRVHTFYSHETQH